MNTTPLRGRGPLARDDQPGDLDRGRRPGVRASSALSVTAAIELPGAAVDIGCSPRLIPVDA